VRFVDREIGRLVERLKQSGEYERTLFVVVADHGEGLGDHGWQHHRLLYQEDIRVPLILVVPGRAPTPPVSALVRTTDIVPSVLQALSIPAPRPLSGRSLLPLLDGQPEEPRTAFADAVNGYDRNAAMSSAASSTISAPRAPGWKLVYRPAPRVERALRLASDPHELTTTSCQPTRAELLLSSPATTVQAFSRRAARERRGAQRAQGLGMPARHEVTTGEAAGRTREASRRTPRPVPKLGSCLRAGIIELPRRAVSSWGSWLTDCARVILRCGRLRKFSLAGSSARRVQAVDVVELDAVDQRAVGLAQDDLVRRRLLA
jgi:hypothetical protein